MSLINCPECGREISDKALACPHCGYPLVNAAPSRPSADIQNQPAGQAGTAPEQAETAPEPAGTAPEPPGTAPEPPGTAPEQPGTAPEQPGTAPEQAGTAPGQAGTAPEQAGTAPGQAGTAPGQPGTAVSESEDWFAKGRAAGWSSTVENIRLDEALAAFRNSIAAAGDNEKQSISCRCTEEVNHLIATLHGLSKKRLVESLALPDTWTLYTEQVTHMISALEEASKWDDSNTTIPEKIVNLCKDLIEGVVYRDPLDNNKSKVWRLSAEQEPGIRARLLGAAKRLKSLDPLYIAPNPMPKKPDSDCFVVAATLGNPYHPKVAFMREFRDGWLAQRKTGALLISLYGKFGPMAAGLISGNRILRALSYCLIVFPAYWAARGLFKRKPGE